MNTAIQVSRYNKKLYEISDYKDSTNQADIRGVL